MSVSKRQAARALTATSIPTSGAKNRVVSGLIAKEPESLPEPR